MDFGRASTFVETVDDPTTPATAVRLVETLQYTGIVEVEFNGMRVTGSSSCWISIRVSGDGTVSVDRRAWIIRICCGS